MNLIKFIEELPETAELHFVRGRDSPNEGLTVKLIMPKGKHDPKAFREQHATIDVGAKPLGQAIRALRDADKKWRYGDG